MGRATRSNLQHRRYCHGVLRSGQSSPSGPQAGADMACDFWDLATHCFSWVRALEAQSLFCLASYLFANPQSIAAPARKLFTSRPKAGSIRSRMANPFTWPKGKHAALSLTFDDARLSQMDRGLPLLDKHGVKATFYVSMSTMHQRLDGWKRAIANGHEVGNHTFSHPCTGNFGWSRNAALENYDLAKME